MSSEERDLEFVRRQLQAVTPPWSDTELKTDLWPQMLRRMEDTPARFGWFEAALATGVAVAFAAFPKLIAVTFWHL